MVKFEKPFEFGSKADTLGRLAHQLTKSTVPEFLSISVAQWQGGERASVLEAITSRFAGLPVIVRSSTRIEDGGDSALAGAFRSIEDVEAADREAVIDAVDEVIASYQLHHDGHANGEGSGEDQVIIQKQIKDVLVSGVLFTQDMNTGAPYYVINYDDESGSTDTITSGSGYTNRTLYVFRDSWHRLASKRFQLILEAVREVEEMTGSINLDVEFALDDAFVVHVFQVRRITTEPNWNRGQALQVSDALMRLDEGLRDRYAGGSDTAGLGGVVLSNMSDWNPAEMIGTTPRPLAFSLYRGLITDRVWRIARQRMGYRERRGRPLMLSLAGQPFIDVRESLHSFVPATVSEKVGNKLVRAWLERLRENSHLHDKIEFEVAITALTPDFDERVDNQFPETLSSTERDEFRTALRHLTNDLISGQRAPIGNQLEAITTLSTLHGHALARLSRPSFETVVQLLEDVTEYGTLPFSILARHAFIASAILRGLVHRRVLSPDAAERFQQSVPTVATEFIRDLDLHSEGALSKSALIERYGHLRPGTYDILSVRYGDQFAHITDSTRPTGERCEAQPFDLGADLRREISELLAMEGYTVDANSLFDYMHQAIQAREYAKFCFTRNISDSLEVIAALGERHGLSRDELSYIDIRDFINCFVEPGGRSIESELRGLSMRGRERHEVARSIRLPSVITRLSDLWIVPLTVEQPNYITRNNVCGEVVAITGSLHDPSVIDHSIVAIESADPGFDWIFTRPILGLVTRFGGANSHMAIRCAEFGLPAAIGCGEQIFERVVRHGHINLNCAEGQILMSRFA